QLTLRGRQKNGRQKNMKKTIQVSFLFSVSHFSVSLLPFIPLSSTFRYLSFYFGKRNFNASSTRWPQSRSLCCPPLTCRNFRSEFNRQPCAINSSRSVRTCPGVNLPSFVPTSSQIRVEGFAPRRLTTRRITP